MKNLFTTLALTLLTITLSAAPSVLLRVRNTGDAGNSVTISNPSAGKLAKPIALKGKTAGTEQRVIAPLSEKETTLTASVSATNTGGKNNLRVYVMGSHEGKKTNRIFHWATVTSVKINGKESLKAPFTAGSTLPLAVRVKKLDKFQISVTYRKASADEQAAAEKTVAERKAKRAAKKNSK